MSTPAPGGYPSPLDAGMQAYWDGQKWHLEASKPTESAEWVGVIIAVTVSMILCTVFPPAIVMVLGVWIWWHYYNKGRQKQARNQTEWDQQHQVPPR